MSTKVELIDAKGNVRTIESALNLKANTRFGVEHALWLSGKDLSAEFNEQVKARNKTGRLYFLRGPSGRKRRHVASAPGETPANRTGNYRKSRDFNVDGAHQLRFGNTAEYAGFLETGTSRMKARPGLGNAVKASERDILRNLSGEVEGRV